MISGVSTSRRLKGAMKESSHRLTPQLISCFRLRSPTAMLV